MSPDSRTEQDFPSVLKRRVEAFPDRNWIVTAEESHTFSDMDRCARRLAGGLMSGGVRPGDTVLVMLPDVVDYIRVWCALSLFGGIEVPVNVHYRGNLLAYLVNDSLARTLIVDGAFLGRFVPLAGQLEHLERIVVWPDPADHDPGTIRQVSQHFEVTGFDSLYGTAYTGPGPRYHDLMGIYYTSGTTGPSKGVTLTHAHVWEYAYGIVEMLDLRESDCYCAPLPLFHIAGKFAVIYASCLVGCTAVLAGSFSASRFWQDVHDQSVTTTFLLGAMANILYRQPVRETDRDNTLERVLMVPLIPEVEDFKERFGCRVSTTWGGTEMNCPTRSGFDLVDNRSCGKVAQDRYEVRIVDEYDQEVEPGVPGEALVRAREPWIMTNGYWNHPEWTASAWRNLWMHTGDMMMRDEDGNLYFVDRIKDAIRRRGENISSMEVEYEINSHPSVLECAVIPAASEDTEQEVMAVIVLRQGHEVGMEELVRYLEPRMAYFMVPRYLEIVDALPKTPTGKIRKFLLRDAGIGEATWDRVAESGNRK